MGIAFGTELCFFWRESQTARLPGGILAVEERVKLNQEHYPCLVEVGAIRSFVQQVRGGGRRLVDCRKVQSSLRRLGLR
jgi:hypothetical protein